MTNKTRVAAIVAVVVAVGAYLVHVQSPSYSGPRHELQVRLGWLHQGQFAGLYVAQEQGYYDERNLGVTLLPLDLEKDQVEELAVGEVDISVMEAHQLLEAIDNGHDLLAVAAVYQTNPHVLAARAESGITSPRDFGGKRIGLAGGEGEGNALFKTFTSKFTSGEPVQYVNLGFDTVDDFKRNRADIIDVYRIDQPYLAAQQGIELTLIPLDAYGFATYGDVLVVTRDFAENNPEVVERFVGASLEGWEYALTHVSEAVGMTMEYAEGSYADTGYQEHIISESIPLVRGDSDRLGGMDLVRWSTLYETMRSAGVLTQNIDVKTVYTNDYLN